MSFLLSWLVFIQSSFNSTLQESCKYFVVGWQKAYRPIVFDVFGLSPFKQNYYFCFMQTVRCLLCLYYLLKVFVRQVRKLCPPPSLITLVILSIPRALCIFCPFCGLFYLFCKLGYFFCIWTWFHFTFRCGHGLIMVSWRSVRILRISSLPNVISLDSFLMLIFIFFLCLFTCLGPFLASDVSCIHSVLSSPFSLSLSLSLSPSQNRVYTVPSHAVWGLCQVWAQITDWSLLHLPSLKPPPPPHLTPAC